jgi:hypothetical protein
MRYLVYLLVLANVVFFLWETGFRAERDSGASYRELEIPSGLERIALAREVAGIPSSGTVVAVEPAGQTPPPEAAPSPGTVPPPPEAKPVQKPVDCFRIGPLQTKDEAEGFLDLLKSHAPKASVETKLGDVPDGWWVLFPKAASLEAGRENRKMLADKGVLDTWLFDRGPLLGAISLGLFKTKEEAEAARKSFMDKSIVAEVVPRLVRGQVYWVKIPWQRPALEFEEIVQVLNTQDPSLHIPAPIPCE